MKPSRRRSAGRPRLIFGTWVDVATPALAAPRRASPAAACPPAAGALPASLPFNIDVTLRADPLTAIMLAMVTFISSLVAIYAIGYMHGDRGYWRFFTYIGLFVFSMTMLVSVSNFVLLYVFWEAVGLCSYLLIGFWYEKPEAAAAGKKAFLVNRVGDFGFALGIVSDLDHLRHAQFSRRRRRGGRIGSNAAGAIPRDVRRRRRGHGDLPAADAGGLRQKRPVPAARLAARRDGRPHARQRA